MGIAYTDSVVLFSFYKPDITHVTYRLWVEHILGVVIVDTVIFDLKAQCASVNLSQMRQQH